MALNAPWSFIQNATATSKAWLDPSDTSFKWTKSGTDYIDHDGTNLSVQAATAQYYFIGASAILSFTSSQLTTDVATVALTNGNLRLDNNKNIYFKSSLGNINSLFLFNASDQMQIGTGIDITYMHYGSGAAVTGHRLYVGGADALKLDANYIWGYKHLQLVGKYIMLDNAQPIYMKDNLGAWKSMLNFTAANIVEHGNGSTVDSHRFYVSSSEKMRITNGGSVQIGTNSATNYGCIVYKNGTETGLYVRQDSTGDIFHADDGGTGRGFKVKGDGTTWIIGSTSNAYFSATGYVLYFDRAGANYVSASNASGTLYLQSGGTDSLVCDTGNDVAVGGFTTPSSSWIGSAGAVFGVAQSGGTRPVMLASGYGSNGVYSGALQFNMTINSSASPNTFDKLGSTAQQGCAAITSGYNGGLFFYAYDGAAETAVTGVNLANQNWMRILPAGKVSIGLVTPVSAGLTIYETNYGMIQLQSSASGTGATDGFQIACGSGPSHYIWGYENCPIWVASNNTQCWNWETNGDSNVVRSGARIGYGTGAGGTVTQGTSRTTGVTINKACGSITLVSAAGTTTWQTFTVTNSVVAATDTIVVVQKSGTDLNEIHVTAVAAGSFNISFRTTGGTTTEQPVFNFAVIKAVTS